MEGKKKNFKKGKEKRKVLEKSQTYKVTSRSAE